MKWKSAIILCCYLIGAAFYVAWDFEVEQRVANPPNGVVNLNQIKWILLAGSLFLFAGTTVLANVVANGVAAFFRRDSSTAKR